MWFEHKKIFLAYGSDIITQGNVSTVAPRKAWRISVENGVVGSGGEEAMMFAVVWDYGRFQQLGEANDRFGMISPVR